MPEATPQFSVVPGAQVRTLLHGRETEVVSLIEEAYRLHGQGMTVNPPSYFLRFPDRPSARIIALPASLGGDEPVDGLKWISSFPDNLTRDLPRASATLILNDPVTGYPISCMESSIISATRTAASAALAADHLSRGRSRPSRVGFVGTGLIARYLHTFLVGTGWKFESVGVYDLDPSYAEGFLGYLRESEPHGEIMSYESPEALVRDCDLIVYATTAPTPHVDEPAWFQHNPLVLHVSLRDLAPNIILDAVNIVDDVEHCLKANTSVHLAEQLTGGRDFIDGTLFDVLTGTVRVDADRPVVFSPFGLGVLDLAVGRFVYDELRRNGDLLVIDNFFAELSRYESKAGSAA
ncbi:2,3-diaminopropionate biosynthesis protein SbnB [Actinoplanes sp. NPDC051346]|uniref:2,3-diaminopropionate biosynthesis protein SbnB n=1 Tax=Actinoplanes sp. NPDC051346 TaxID=3155048 RepID=UPI003430C714